MKTLFKSTVLTLVLLTTTGTVSADNLNTCHVYNQQDRTLLQKMSHDGNTVEYNWYRRALRARLAKCKNPALNVWSIMDLHFKNDAENNARG